MLDTSNLAPGQEQYEEYFSPTIKKKLVQYDYRDTDGKVFSCVRPTLEECRKAKDTWLEQKRATAQ